MAPPSETEGLRRRGGRQEEQGPAAMGIPDAGANVDDEEEESGGGATPVLCRSVTSFELPEDPDSRPRRMTRRAPGLQPLVEPRDASHDPSETLILCIGIMLTGEHVAQQALQILRPGARVYGTAQVLADAVHWEQIIHNGGCPDLFRQLFRTSEVALGSPVSVFWEEICKARKCKVILLHRDEDKWWSSLAKSREGEQAAGIFQSFWFSRLEDMFMPTYARFARIVRFSYASLLSGFGYQQHHQQRLVESLTRRNYRSFNSYVESTLQDQNLLVYDTAEGWEPLCGFLGVPVPDVAFPVPKKGKFIWSPQVLFSGLVEGWLGGQEDDDEEEATSRHAEVAAAEFKSAVLKVAGVFLAFTLVVAAVVVGCCQVSEVASVVVGLIGVEVVLVSFVVSQKAVATLPAVNIFTTTMKVVATTLALNVVLVAYGVVKEALVTRDKASITILMLVTRGSSAVAAAVLMKVRHGRVSFGVPWHQFSSFAVTNELSTWASYEMLKYVSFPVQTMAKSCVILPSMIMGRVLHGTRYSVWEYAQTGLVVVAVGVMQLEHSVSKKKKAGAEESPYGMYIGVALLAFFFACDSFTSQYQTKLYKKFKCNQYQLMLGGNLAGFTLTLVANLHQGWGLVEDARRTLGGGAVTARAVALGALGLVGQSLIYYTIREFGAVVFAWITTARKLISVVVSIVVFGHGITPIKVGCVSTAFAVITARVRAGKKA